MTVSPQSQRLQGKIEDCEQSNLTRAYINTEFNYQGISVISISDSDKLGIDSLICIGKLACLWTESYSLKEICVWQIISSQRFEAAEEKTNQLSRDRFLTKRDQWRRLEEITEKLGLRGGIIHFDFSTWVYQLYSNQHV